jgi:EAL domain-containing protein (putative c-di-GMP-specific phosphodiesterase class I)
VNDFLDFVQERKNIADYLVFEFRQDKFEKINPEQWGVIKKLTDLGFKLSLDHIDNWLIDVEKLFMYGFRYMKISRDTFKKGLLDKGNMIPPSQMKALLNDYGIKLIVEKVENQDDYQQILSLGNVDMGQGYEFGTPEKLDRSRFGMK